MSELTKTPQCPYCGHELDTDYDIDETLWEEDYDESKTICPSCNKNIYIFLFI